MVFIGMPRGGGRAKSRCGGLWDAIRLISNPFDGSLPPSDEMRGGESAKGRYTKGKGE